MGKIWHYNTYNNVTSGLKIQHLSLKHGSNMAPLYIQERFRVTRMFWIYLKEHTISYIIE